VSFEEDFPVDCRSRLRVPAFATTYILTVAGFGGEEDYEKRFVLLANDTDKILRGGGATDRVIETLKGPEATKATVNASLAKIASDAKAQDVLILMMIGHGTFDWRGIQVQSAWPRSFRDRTGCCPEIRSGGDEVFASVPGSTLSPVLSDNSTIRPTHTSGTKNVRVTAA